MHGAHLHRLGCGRPACGPLGRGVQYGPVGMSAGQIKGSVTVPYTFQGEGSPLPRAVAARKPALVHADEADLWAKQLVNAPSGGNRGGEGAAGYPSHGLRDPMN